MPGYLLIGLSICLGAGAVWWVLQKPSNNRIWADDVSQLLQSEVQGDQVKLINVRNFEWRTETDYSPRWEKREYDLSLLQSADLILSYWMGPHIAHTLVSFGFTDGRQLVYSLEIRKEKGEQFSAIAGFFRQYESILVAADERDALVADFVKRMKYKGPVFQISALTREGCEHLIKDIFKHIKAQQVSEQPPEYVDPRFADPTPE